MKAVEITGEKEVRLVDRPDPKPKGEQVLVKIIIAPMCTEYKAYKNGWKTDCLGHEAAGEVTAIDQQGTVKPGDRVVVMPQYPCGKCPLCLKGDYIHCQNILNVNEITGNTYCTATYTQYTVKNDWLLVPIPADMSYEHASMACCGLGPTFGAMQIMQVDAFDTVLIAGAGPVGFGGVINGVSRGARVITIEPHPYRVKLAKELGAVAVIDPNNPDALKQIMDLTGGVGVDKSIDCAGIPSVQRLLIDATRRKGHMSFIAEAGELTIHVANVVYLTVLYIWAVIARSVNDEAILT